MTVSTHEAGTDAAKARKKPTRPHVPAALVDVALIDGPTSAATGDVSISQWHELVRIREAPQPVIREPRCTRWRLIDVRNYWAERAARGVNAQAAERMTAQARKASAKAAEQRRASAVAAGQ